MKAKKLDTTEPFTELTLSSEDLLSKLKEKELLIKEKDDEIFKLRAHLAYLIRQKFGRKTERYLDPNQLTLFEMQELLTKVEIEEQDTPPIVTVEVKIKKKPKRKPIPAEIPRQTEVIEPENLPEGAKKIGEEVTEKLEFTPGKFWVRRIVRPKYSVPQEPSILIGNLPSFAIEKAIAGASLIAHLLVGKYVDHLPFYRMVSMFKRSKVDLSEATVNNWFVKVTELLEPLYQGLKKQTLSSGYIQADETTIKVQTDKDKSSTHQGYFWVYHAPLIGALFFDYDPSRAGEVPNKTLATFTGVLQTDGYQGYENLPMQDKIIRLACMAHARRYFENAKAEDPHFVNYILGQIQRLYAIERQTQELSPEQRLALRQSQAVPILDNIKARVDSYELAMLPQVELRKALVYLNNHWSRLYAYTQDGTYLIDNNQIENKIRPVALGRKNYLFAGSHEAAQKAAMVYSLMAACKVNEVNPQEWLTDILDKIPDYKANKIAELLPANWKKNR
jgi:transposase